MNKEELVNVNLEIDRMIKESKNHLNNIYIKGLNDDFKNINLHIDDLFFSLNDLIESYQIIISKKNYGGLWKNSNSFLLNGIFEGFIRVLIIHENRREIFTKEKHNRSLEKLKPSFKTLLINKNIDKIKIKLLIKLYEYFQIHRNNFGHFSLGSSTYSWDKQLYFQFFAYVLREFNLENKLRSWKFIEEIASRDIEMCSTLRGFNLYKK